MAEHGLTALIAIAMWWASTIAILILCGLPRATVRWSLGAATLGLAGALYGLVHSAWDNSAFGAYVAFSCGLGVWAWIEITFLFGVLTGPRTTPCPQDATGWLRFRLATETLLYHELAILAGAVVVVALTWSAPNQTGVHAFLILMVMRISAKLNIFLGVPNLTDEFMPAHLAYLKTYFRKRHFSALFPISIALGGVIAAALFVRVGTALPGTAQAVGAVLALALVILAIIEHLFMVIPVRDAVLWRWALPQLRVEPPNKTSHL